MRWSLAILAIGLGYLLFKQLAWIKFEEPLSEQRRRVFGGYVPTHAEQGPPPTSKTAVVTPPRGHRRVQ